MSQAEQRLRAAVKANHDAVTMVRAADFPRQRFERLQRFQRRRLARSHADLAADPHHRPAIRFFLEELYGGRGYGERDRQLEQVLPLMLRLLPTGVLMELAGAFELQAMSIRLDAQMASRLEAEGAGRVDARSYGAAYRAIDRRQRSRQLQRVRSLGLGLAEVVRQRRVLVLIGAMRLPAHAAGLELLQGFLERGLRAFRALPDARAFVELVHAREYFLMQRLYAGDDGALARTPARQSA